jgi:hypothetical protein
MNSGTEFYGLGIEGRARSLAMAPKSGSLGVIKRITDLAEKWRAKNEKGK